MRRLLAMCVSLLLLTVALPSVAAQPTPWATLIHDSVSGTVYSVGSTGDSTSFVPPLPANATAQQPNTFAVSPDGSILAYMTYQQAPVLGGGPYDGFLVVYDRRTSQSQNYPFRQFNTHSLNYLGSTFVFDGSRLAMGYHLPSGWNIATLDISTAQYADVLSQNDAIAGTVNNDTTVAAMTQPTPVITNYEGGLVRFVMVPGEAPQFASELPAFEWNIAAGTVMAVSTPTGLSYDYLTGPGDVVQAIENTNFANNRDAFFFEQANVLLGGSTQVRPTPFYTNPSVTLARPSFIDGGARILVGAFPSLEQQDTPTTWLALNRDGTQADIVSGPGQDYGVRDADGITDGALLLAETNLAAQQMNLQMQPNSLGLLEYVNGQRRLVWVGPPNVLVMNIIWSTPVAASPNLPLFGSAASIPAELVVGGQAQTFTTAGDGLNVRTGPDTSTNIIVTLVSGTTVELLEGPLNAGGLTWWRIRTPSNAEGWAVEAVGELQTLRPVGGATTQPVQPGQPTQPGADGGTFVVDLPLTAGGQIGINQEPRTDSPVIALVNDGSVLQGVGEVRTVNGQLWRQVQTGATVGWLLDELLTPQGAPAPTPVPAPQAALNPGDVAFVVGGGTAPLLGDADVNSARLADLQPGRQVAVLETRAGFARVLTGNNEGWMETSRIAANPQPRSLFNVGGVVFVSAARTAVIADINDHRMSDETYDFGATVQLASGPRLNPFGGDILYEVAPVNNDGPSGWVSTRYLTESQPQNNPAGGGNVGYAVNDFLYAGNAGIPLLNRPAGSPAAGLQNGENVNFVGAPYFVGGNVYWLAENSTRTQRGYIDQNALTAYGGGLSVPPQSPLPDGINNGESVVALNVIGLRDQPTFDLGGGVAIQVGATGSAVSEPVISDGTVWFQVEFGGQGTGWVPQYENGRRLIYPTS